jgi:hypothetical protein
VRERVEKELDVEREAKKLVDANVESKRNVRVQV